MFTGDELAAYVGRWVFRALVVIVVVSVLIGWGLAKLFD
jgi:hypothetical protein